jgi:hypothetical protein
MISRTAAHITFRALVVHLPSCMAIAMTTLSVMASAPALAAEGASSDYLPGTAGDFGVALPPEPGLQIANILWIQSGDVGRAVVDGKVDIGLDVDVVLDIVAATYTFDTSVLGGLYTVGIAVPFGYAKLDAKATGPFGGSAGFSEDSFNLSDIAVTPLQLNWSAGNFHFKFSETVIIPTGAYDVNNPVNLGRNYWSFDTLGAVTWFNPESGTEVSVAPGIMFNTENNATDYKTGTEFHVDFMANQFLAETFAVGVRGYYYQQLTGDSGSGAVLGDFKSESFGIGPGFLWTPAAAGGKLAVVGKWMHDLHAKNRFESDYGILTVAWQF